MTKPTPDNHLYIGTKLEDRLILTPEEHDDYIQFTLGAQAWPSNDQSHGVPSCSEGGWNDKGMEEVSNFLLREARILMFFRIAKWIVASSVRGVEGLLRMGLDLVETTVRWRLVFFVWQAFFSIWGYAVLAVTFIQDN